MLRMQQEREKQGRSRADVAREARISPTFYGWFERRRLIPTAGQLVRVSQALGHPVEHRAELLEEVQ